MPDDPHHPHLRLAELPEDLEGLQREARNVLGRIRQLYAALALDPDPGGQDELELRRLLDLRDALASRLGFAVLKVLGAGGEVVEQYGEVDARDAGARNEDVAPVPEEADQEADEATVEEDQDVDAPGSELVQDESAHHADLDDHPSQDDTVEVTLDEEVEDEPTQQDDVEGTQGTGVERPDEQQEQEPQPSNAKPADPAALLALAQSGLAPSWSQARTPSADQRALAELLKAIGKPGQIKKRQDVGKAMQRVTEAIAHMDAWLAQPQDVRKALIGLVSSLARQVQDEGGFGLPKAEDEQLRAAFSLMTAWSGKHRPGFVPGLSRHNSPDNGSWLEDARAWWSQLQEHIKGIEEADTSNPELALAELTQALQDNTGERSKLKQLVQRAVDAGLAQSDPRLVGLLTPYQSLLRGTKGLKTLKTCLREAVKLEEAEQEDQDRQSPVPEDWPLFELTRGKHAVVVGGDPRPQAARRIREGFELAKVDWDELDTRRVRALADKVRGGGVDIVIILRGFISHSDQDVLMPACAEGGVPVCVVDTGYGVTQVRSAMERYWGGHT